MTNDSTGRESHDSHGHPHIWRSGLRKVFEAGMLGGCIILILSIAAYLVYQGLHTEKLIPVAVRIGSVQISSQSAAAAPAQAIVPVEVYNRGSQTLHDIALRITTTDREPYEVSIAYLEEQAHQTIYVYLTDPQADVTVKPLYYRLK